MSTQLMVLPSREPGDIRLVTIPEDMEEHEAFRHATGLIARVEESHPDYGVDGIEDALEEHGFERVEFILGPELS